MLGIRWLLCTEFLPKSFEIQPRIIAKGSNVDCILHIGLHKTGSSSIQNSLRAYDDGKTFYARLGNPNHSVAFRTLFSEDYLDYHVWKRKGYSNDKIEERKAAYSKALVQQISRNDRSHIIFSGEGISNLSQKELKKMAETIGRHCDDVKIIACVRDPLSFAISYFQQELQGGRTKPLEVINPGYRAKLEKFLNVFGKESVEVRDFKRAKLVKGDVVFDFCDIAGLNITSTDVSRENESISVGAMKILFHFNRKMPLIFGDPDLAKTRWIFVSALNYATKETGRPSKDVFSALVAPQATGWLTSELGITFDPIPNKAPMQRLSEYLHTFEDALIEEMLSFLKKNGESNDYDRDPIKIASKIFFLSLLSEGFCSQSGTFIKNKSRPQLPWIARVAPITRFMRRVRSSF